MNHKDAAVGAAVVTGLMLGVIAIAFFLGLLCVVAPKIGISLTAAAVVGTFWACVYTSMRGHW